MKTVVSLNLLSWYDEEEVDDKDDDEEDCCFCRWSVDCTTNVSAVEADDNGSEIDTTEDVEDAADSIDVEIDDVADDKDWCCIRDDAYCWLGTCFWITDGDEASIDSLEADVDAEDEDNVDSDGIWDRLLITNGDFLSSVSSVLSLTNDMEGGEECGDNEDAKDNDDETSAVLLLWTTCDMSTDAVGFSLGLLKREERDVRRKSVDNLKKLRMLTRSMQNLLDNVSIFYLF